MSMEPSDYEQEEAFDRLYQELGPQWAADNAETLYKEYYPIAIQEFTRERLQSYYLRHPDLAKKAHSMLDHAVCLSSIHPPASLIFAASATEITIKTLLTKPIVNGLVHSEAVADLIMGLTPGETGSDAFKQLFFGVLNKTVQLDLITYKRKSSRKTLWEEWRQLQKERNALIHSGREPSAIIMAWSIDIPSEFLKVVFPKLLATLGMQMSAAYEIVSA